MVLNSAEVVNMPAKLIWRKVEGRTGLWLAGSVPDQHFSVSELESLLADIVQWCETTKCGRRMSYEMWKFKTEAEQTAFLLRWS